VPPKVKGKRGRRDTSKPLSGLDVESLLNREKRERISPNNTIPEFKQMLDSPADDNVIYDAAKQMANIIRTHISNSTGNTKEEEVKADMQVFREYMLEFEMPEVWNDFIRDFKKRVIKGELGGDRRDFWSSLRWINLGLIDKKALEISDVTEKEAAEVGRMTPLDIAPLIKASSIHWALICQLVADETRLRADLWSSWWHISVKG
jgi:ATP-dependent DNA helicase 2 subunit 2